MDKLMPPAEAMLQILRTEGVTRIFGNPGTTELPFLDALAGADDLPYILGLQEASVVAMADGYARATRRPAFVNLHVAAGLANGLISLLNARRSRTPLVVTAGQQDRRFLRDEPMLAGDLVALASPAVKHAVQIEHAYDLPQAMRHAFDLAVREPAGPVFLSIPMDVLDEATSVSVLPKTPMPKQSPANGIDEAAAILLQARAPVVIVGDGVARGGAEEALVAIAERLGAPVFHQPMHDRLDFPMAHPLHAGMLAPRYSSIRHALSAYDVAFAVGARLFTAHHYTPGPAVPPDLRIVQLDADAGEIGRNIPVELGLVGAIEESLRLLARELGPSSEEARARRNVVQKKILAARAELEAQARAANAEDPLDPLACAHAIASGLPRDAVVVDEAITVGPKLRSLLRLQMPGSFVHTVGAGLGWGIGAATGHRLGMPERPVVAVLGDGCAMFGIQGLWSAAHYRVPVTFVVLNNGEYRTLKETLTERGKAAAKSLAESGRFPGLDLAPPALDWTKAADFFGMAHRRINSCEELHSAVAESSGREEPLLLDVAVQPMP